MKLVTLYTHPVKLDAVKKVVWDLGYRSLSVGQVEGYAFQKGVSDKDGEFIAAPGLRIKVELALRDSDVEKFIELALELTRTGRVGDGKIFVVAIEQVVRVRTGERGEAAL